GSGAVKITGAHDFNDYEVAKRGGIPMYRLMDTKGRMRDDGAAYAEAAGIAGTVARGERELSEAEADALNLVPDHLRGLDRFEAREAVVDEITGEGLAVMVPPHDPRLGRRAEARPTGEPPLDASEGGEMRTDEEALVPLVEAKPIMQPFGDRSKVVIEPMLTDQWFVDTAQIVGPALDAVRGGTVKIVPESGEKVYYNWLDNIEPWCISRQLWWGHQIPVWYGPDSVGDCLDAPDMPRVDASISPRFCGATFEGVRARAEAKYGRSVREFPSKMEAHDFMMSADMTNPATPVGLYRDPDVLDTWFSSGLWPIGTLGWPEDTDELKRYFPTSDLITGQDILFFWVARMMMMQLAVTGEVPFHNVYLHGLVRDAKGKKMSKSTGNVVDPLEVIDEYGADALRFTNAAMASLGGVLKLDMQRIAGYRNFTTKLWNACRFAEMNGALGLGGDRPEATATVNRWIVGETAKTREAVDAALAAYRFNDAADALYKFIWNVVCDWYVEFAKPLFDGDRAEETKATMSWVLDQCMLMLHPICPFITEELWGTRDRALMTSPWPTYGAELVDADADREVNWTIAAIEAIRSARAQMNVPASAKVPLIQTQIGDAEAAALRANWPLIQRMARVESIDAVDAMPKGAATIAAPGATFGMPLADLIDVDAEKARLEKSLAKLDKEIKGLEGRVNNSKFAASAPPEVVEEARGNLMARSEERGKLADALSRLAEL
ncbi:MAG: valine--tRNA ligase, partial [Shimia sp.]